MPVTRPEEARRAIEAVLSQPTRHQFELLTVGTGPGATVVVEELNPSVRRNRAAAQATGDILAFIDDDAFAAPGWIDAAVDYLDQHAEALALGGPDPPPPDSTTGELIADTLLAAPWIGSGILCHENRPGIRQIRRPYDVALVNLFVRRKVFSEVGGFDESIGYVGEDTALIEELMRRGSVVYHSGVVVHHRRRAFPAAYLRQRWRYRRKTGHLLAAGIGAYARNPRLWLFLALPLILLVLAVAAPAIAVLMLIFYLASCLAFGVRVTRLPLHWWPAIPFLFLVHHAVYFLGTVSGFVSGKAGTKWTL